MLMRFGAIVRDVAEALGRRRVRVVSTSLRDRIARKCGAGLLPTARPLRTWAGYGRGSDLCSACDELILPAQTQCEFGDEIAGFLLHPACYRLWEAEVRRPEVRLNLDIAS